MEYSLQSLKNIYKNKYTVKICVELYKTKHNENIENM